MREVRADSMGSLPDARAAHRPFADRVRRLVAVVCASLCLASCGSARIWTSAPAGGIASAAAATGTTRPTPSQAAGPLSGVHARAPGAPVPTPAPSGRELIRGSQLTFTSLRSGYTVTVSANDWLVIETPGSWDGTFAPYQFNPDPGTDWIRDPGVATIEIGVLAVPAGTTLAAWEASEAPAVRMLECEEVPPPERAMAGGTSVLLLPETCPKAVVGENRGNEYFLNAFAIHGRSGLVAQWNSERGHEAADRASFLAILATWTWTSH